MFPLLSGIITGGASLLGSMFSSETSAKNTQAQIQASQQQQATQNEFTEKMSNTAYQRATADMKNAGLNPMMMFGSGAAASTPAGSAIQAPMPQNTHPMGNLGSNVEKALNAAVTAQTMEKTTEAIANMKVENAKLRADVDLSRAHGSESTSRTKTNELEAQKREYELPAAKLHGVSAVDVLQMDPTIRKGIKQGEFQNKHYGGTVGGLVGSAEVAYNKLKNLLNEHSAKSSSEKPTFNERWEKRIDRWSNQ